jgi:putative Ig domain-containing protein
MKQRHRVPLLALLSVSGALLAACGGDDEAVAAADPPTSTNPPTNPPATNPPPANPPPANPPPANPPPTNSAPRITGTPLTSVLQGSAYAFSPSATDADGNTLMFSIANAPAWATFNSSTGRLSGTPTAANIGSYNNITISVSDGSASASLPAFSIQVVALAIGSATLSWTPPTQNTDGSPLNNLAGYKIYWGTAAGSYPNSVTVNNPGLATYVVGQLTPAKWYFAVTAYSATGTESGFSNVATKTVQ